MNFEWLSSLQIQKNCALIKWPPAIVVVFERIQIDDALLVSSI